MSKHSLATMRRCGELRFQGWKYRDIQQYIGKGIGRRTVKRYAREYLALMSEMTDICLRVLNETTVQKTPVAISH